ncbi:MAG: L-seryl-tRNA(Sec) selenium transferase [Proteobacteria bacterium]|nr:L-seryl-tRNA(Sec) selenium transferase [Pseudomonadota bacterium]
MEDRQKLLRKLPKIDLLLQAEEVLPYIRALGRDAVVRFCREAVTAAKDQAIEKQIEPNPDRITADALSRCKRAQKKVLGRVINGTGVLLHTNLGRAPLGARFFEKIGKIAGGYCNLEIDTLERKRGIRGHHVSNLLRQLCEAEDAIVVNNNAAALFLILRELAVDKEVIVSRGELVQIGGGFRIPDILVSSGAALREVGTTNITTTDDYRAAINQHTAMILKVHRANFQMEGFVKTPSVRDLAREGLGDTHLVSDLGSGNMVRTLDDQALGEPTPADMLREGAELVCFSCDKMLGGVQGGVIAGKADLIRRLRKNPIMRAVRVDKVTYAALQIILSAYLRGETSEIVLWEMTMAGKPHIQSRIDAFLRTHELERKEFVVVNSEATFGGGSTPGGKIASAAVRIDVNRSPDQIARFFQECEPPVVGTVKEGAFQLDFRTILPEDEAPLADACKQLLNTT